MCFIATISGSLGLLPIYFYATISGPGVGFFCQFVLMPLLSFLIGYIATEDKLFRYRVFQKKCVNPNPLQSIPRLLIAVSDQQCYNAVQVFIQLLLAVHFLTTNAAQLLAGEK